MTRMTGEVSLEFLNAAHGDTILISWSTPPRLALVDGGPTGAFEAFLGPRLEELRSERVSEGNPLAIDLVCVSHVDDDHISGIVRLLTDLRRKRHGLPAPYVVRRLWHNSFEELIAAAGASLLPEVEAEVARMAMADAVVAASVNQGRAVRDLGRALNIHGNEPFAGPILAGSNAAVDGLEFTIVAPGTEALDRLEEKWRAAKQRQNASVLAAAFADRSISNLSSISFVLGGPNERALLTADARGDRIIEGLEAIGLLTTGGTAHFEVLQVPHHGSANNSDQQFFERVTADNYVISADGVAHSHPDPETLRWIVNARGSDDYAIHLTNPIAPAMAELTRLKSGRNFAVHARSDLQRGISVSFCSHRSLNART
jgi:beta-lactamase superfamily II metal-dependent hydrolase